LIPCVHGTEHCVMRPNGVRGDIHRDCGSVPTSAYDGDGVWCSRCIIGVNHDGHRSKEKDDDERSPSKIQNQLTAPSMGIPLSTH
jgi:hypothetical protein